jgi:dihydroorotate dehydrogenase electron transfer subunit
MSEHQENSIVHAVEQLSDSFYRLTLHTPLIAAAAQPGQFVMAACGPSLDPLLRRPFSIHRCIGSDFIQLLFRVAGRGTRLLIRSSTGTVAQPYRTLGPRISPVTVHLSLPDRRRHRHRAPPLFGRSIAERIVPAAPSCTVLLGSRSAQELKPLAAEFSTLGCRVETATDDNSLGHHGLVTDLLPPILPKCRKSMSADLTR